MNRTCENDEDDERDIECWLLTGREMMTEIMLEVMQKPQFGDSVIHLLNPITEGYGGIYNAPQPLGRKNLLVL